MTVSETAMPPLAHPRLDGRERIATIAATGRLGPDSCRSGPPSPHHIRRETDDPDEAESVVADIYLPNRLELPERPAPVGMEVAGLRLGALTVGRLSYGREVRLRTADAENVHVNVVLRGEVDSRNGVGESVTTRPGEGVVFSPGAPADISWSAHSEQLCLMISHGALEAELEKLLGRPLRGRLSFDFVANVSSPLAHRWRTVVDLLAEELDHPTEMSEDPVVRQHLEHLVMDGLLLGQPHNHSDAVNRDRPISIGPAIKRAVELLEDRPFEPWTTISLAAAVHLSVRALQEGFRRDLDTPPMTYLRQVRLRRAYSTLQTADPGTTSVRTVAAGLGILHMGRFAAAYRAAFGESPSDTLNRPA